LVKKGNSFAKVVTIFLALIIALALTGMGYGVWTDTLSIIGTVETGTYDVELSPGTPDPSENVSCTIDGNTLNITITDAAVGWYYYRNFDVHNTGTVPVKIESIAISSPAGVTTTVSGIAVDDVIEGGEMPLGTVNMQVTVAAESYNVQVTIDTVLWNQ